MFGLSKHHSFLAFITAQAAILCLNDLNVLIGVFKSVYSSAERLMQDTNKDNRDLFELLFAELKAVRHHLHAFCR
jgi:hypothetical protein